MNPFGYSLNRKRFTSSGHTSSCTISMLENSHHSREVVVVRSLLKELHMKLDNLLVDYHHHDRSNLFRRTSKVQRRD